MSQRSTILAISLLGLRFLVTSPETFGQAPASDTTKTTSDIQPAARDTTQRTGASQAPSDSALQRTNQDTLARSLSDTVRTSSDTARSSTDAARSADTTRSADATRSALDAAGSPSDTSRRQATGSPAASASTSAAPVDSTLRTACSGELAGVARDLLVIVFAPEAGAAERTAAAKSVEGKLLGSVASGEPGAYYLRVPTGGEEFRLRAAADQLIQLPQVRQVGSRACPALPAPEKSSRNTF